MNATDNAIRSAAIIKALDPEREKWICGIISGWWRYEDGTYRYIGPGLFTDIGAAMEVVGHWVSLAPPNNERRYHFMEEARMGAVATLEDYVGDEPAEDGLCIRAHDANPATAIAKALEKVILGRTSRPATAAPC